MRPHKRTGLREIDGIGPKRAERLERNGFKTIGDLYSASREDLLDVEGISTAIADSIERQLKDIPTRRRPETVPSPDDIEREAFTPPVELGVAAPLLSSTVLDRIERAASDLDDLPVWTPDGLTAALEDHLTEYGEAAQLVGDVLGDQPGAHERFRSWLRRRPGRELTDAIGYTPKGGRGGPLGFGGGLGGDFGGRRGGFGGDGRGGFGGDGRVGYTPRPSPRPGGSPCEFVGMGTVGGLYLSARFAARDEREWQGLQQRVNDFVADGEWGESLHAAARHYERTGDGHPLRVRGRLYARAMGWRPGEGPLGPDDGPLGPDDGPLGPGGGLGGPGDGPRGPAGPDDGPGGGWRPPLDDCALHRRGCVKDLIDRAGEIGSQADERRPDRPAVYADNITSVTSQACAGEELVVRGHDFGDSQPANVQLLLPSENGCRPVEVPATQWTNTEIRFDAPAWAERGCVGFRDTDAADAWADYYGWLGEQTDELHSVSLTCRALGAGTPILPKGPLGGISQCPPCKEVNRFDGTIPEIAYFRVDGDDEAVVGPADTVTFSWLVSNADEIAVTRTSSDGPSVNQSRTAGPMFNESHSVPLSENEDVDASYRLKATNACGSVTADIDLFVRRRPSVAIRGIEVIQAVQTFTTDDDARSNEVFLVEGKRTMVRAYVDSGLPTSYNNGGLVPVQAELKTTPLSGQSGAFDPPVQPLSAASSTAARPSPARTPIGETVNFEVPLPRLAGRVEFTVTVTPDDPHARWRSASDSVTVRFDGSPELRMVVLRVRNQQGGTTTTATNAEVGTALTDIRAAYPIADDQLRLFTTGNDIITTSRNYDTGGAWGDLLDDIEEVAEEWQDNGEIWCGAVPAAATTPGGPIGRAIQGMLWWHSKATWDSGVFSTPAHEIGHAIGFGHDRRRTDTLGLHVPNRQLLPVGSGLLMAQAVDFGVNRWPDDDLYQDLNDELWDEMS